MLNSTLAEEVLNSAASVEGLMEACCNLLLLPAPSLFTPNLERVLLQLGLHSRELGLRLINLLLNNRSTPLLQGITNAIFLQNTNLNPLGDKIVNPLFSRSGALATGTQETSTVQLVVELLQQLCSAQDEGTGARMVAVLSWLYNSAINAVARFNSNSSPVSPSAVYVHCISAIIWKAHRQSDVNYDLQALLTNQLFK